jgi:hypothetical protein
VAALFGPGHVDVDKPLTPQKLISKKRLQIPATANI